MRLAEIRARLRGNLGGVRSDWTNEVLDGGMARAIDDLDRLLPNEVIADFTLTFAITAEVWASGTLGSEVTLTNKRLKPQSEVVKDAAGTTTYVRDTDYTMDYISGTITTITTANGGAIVDSSNNQIDYTILEVYVDISSLTDLIRIFRVEYPGGQVPAEFQTFYTWGNFLALSSRGRETQQRLTEGRHLWVYFHAKHTTPDKDTDGTWPPHLDEVVLKGAEAYCLLTKAMELRYSAKTRHTSIATALGTDLAVIALEVDTALTDTRTQASSAVADMATIDGHIATMLATLVSAGAFLSSASTSVVDAQTQADLVASDIEDADTPISSALTRLASVDALIVSISALLTDAESYAGDAGSPLGIAKTSLTAIQTLVEASDGRLTDVDASRAQASAWLEAGGTSLGQAGIDLNDRARLILSLLMSSSSIADPIGLVGDQLTFAGTYISTGLALINKVNIGDTVSEMYRRYADTQISAARMRYDEWLTFLGQIDRAVGIANGWTAQAAEWRAHAEGYLSEANTALGEVSALLSKIAAYQVNVGKHIDTSQAYIGQSRALSEVAGVSVGNVGRAIEQADGYNAAARTRLEKASEGNKLVASHVALAAQYVRMAEAKIAEGTAMQAVIDAILNRVGQKIEVSRVYQGEADRRLQEIGYKLQETDRYAALATQESDLADKFDESGIRIKDEFMGILTDRAQVRTESALTPTRQEAPS